MAEVRKSDFVGDTYGDWVVVVRAPAQDRKRAWVVKNTISGDIETVLQTELSSLGSQDPWASATTPEPPDLTNPWATGDIDIEGAEEFVADWVSPRWPAVGPGECKHGVDILECPEDGPKVGPAGREALEKVKPASRKIAESVIAANALVREAIASVALDGDTHVIEGYTHVIEEDLASEVRATIEANLPALEKAFAEVAGEFVPENEFDVEIDWSYDLPFSDTYELIESGGGIGAAAEEEVSEAVLDERAPAQDPLRASIRKLMGEISELRAAIATLGAQADVLIELVDDTLKVALTK